MHRFRYNKTDELVCESVALQELAAKEGTPLYVYSSRTIEDNYRRLQCSGESCDARICYAVQANSNLAVLRLFHNLGASFKVASGGEMRRVLAAGGNLRTSVFAGLGKTVADIEFALQNEIFSFHAESEAELDRINQVAGRMERRAAVAIRIDPGVDSPTQASGKSARIDTKFGIPLVAALDAYSYAKGLEHIDLRGVQIQIGSHVATVNPLVTALEKVLPTVVRLQEKFGLAYFSVGGGIGIPYRDALASGRTSWWKAEGGGSGENRLTPEIYGAALERLLQPLGLAILIESGRFLTGNAGVLLTRVEHIKRAHGKRFVITDASMNDLMRPALFDAYHEIVPVTRKEDVGVVASDVVGPTCEPADTFAANRELQRVRPGDLLAILSAGAYGASLASRFYSRASAAEVMVKEGEYAVVGARESFEQMVANDRIPDFL